MNKYKKNTGVFLILLLALPLIVSICISIKIKWVQHEMLEKMEQSHLHVISIDSNQVKWNIKNKELIIEKQLFDVKYAVNKGSKIVFYGLFDKEETRLEMIIEKSMSSNENSKEINKINLFLQQLQFIKNDTDPNLSKIDIAKNKFVDAQLKWKSNHYIETITPPPNLFFL
jgi:hypothetical protein